MPAIEQNKNGLGRIGARLTPGSPSLIILACPAQKWPPAARDDLGGQMRMVIVGIALAFAAVASADELNDAMSAAQKCSSEALMRYAVTSTDTADAVAIAAFDRCSMLWGAAAEIMAARIEADPGTAEVRKNAVRYGLPVGSPLQTLKIASDTLKADFLAHASTLVFELRAQAAH
jgi:hypothetical protein